jgi:PAS domain S-box-containing protein
VQSGARGARREHGSEDCAGRMETKRRRLLDPEPQRGWETLFWDVFERTLNPIILVDELRGLLEANSAAVELLGYCPPDLVGRSIDELITSPSRAQRDKDWQRMVDTGEQSGTYTFRRRDGSRVEIDFASRVVRVGQRSLVVAVALPLGRVTLARRVGDQAVSLTVREREVVALIALGHETPRIAEKLGISAATVRTHVQNAMVKLGVHTRAELVAVAFSRGELLQAGRDKDLPGA